MPKVAYLDSSVVLTLILNQPQSRAARNVVESLQMRDYHLASSKLTLTEVNLALFRMTQSVDLAALTGPVEKLFSTISLTNSIMTRAGLIPYHIGPVGALHIATALELDDPDTLMVSSDDTMLDVSSKMGLRVQSVTS